MMASGPDWLRLLVVPAFAWAAYRDWQTRTVPNALWPPLAGLGAVLLAWDLLALSASSTQRTEFVVRVMVGILWAVVWAVGLWHAGAFGGADAKAVMVLGVLLPTAPAYSVAGQTYPVVESGHGVFSLTVMMNAALIVSLYVVLDRVSGREPSGIPFVVPLFGGLLTALTVGGLLPFLTEFP